MWYSRVHYLFKKLFEYNPKYFSKNGFIQMIERVYKDGEFKAGRCLFHIYCTICDSLVIICENTIEYGNDHLKKCIAKTAKMHSNFVWKNMKKGKSVSSLSSDKVDGIFINYSVYPSRGYHLHNTDYEFKERIAYSIFNSTKVIQRAWRVFKLRPKMWVKQVWNMVRNDGTSDDKKYLDVILQKIKNPYTCQQYDLRSAERIAMINKGYNYPSLGEYKEYYLPDNWIERKKDQL